MVSRSQKEADLEARSSVGNTLVAPADGSEGSRWIVTLRPL